MTTRSNPFEELERLFERMSRQFEESSGVWDPDRPLGGWRSETGEIAVDLVEHDDEFVAAVDLPGFDRDDVRIEVTDHTLRIEAEREEETDEAESNYLRRERRHEASSRSIRMPDEVDKEAVSARMNNGVLTITLPKREAESARTIDIQ